MSLIQNFDASKKFLKNRVTMITNLTDEEFHQKLDDSIKPHVFCCGQIAKLNVAEKMREVCAEYTAGKISMSDAYVALNKFAKNNGESMIHASRIKFILIQEQAKADAVGQWEVSMDSEVLEMYPYFKYHSKDDAYSHPGHPELNGLVLPKKHDFWRTHYPPWDFNCRCFVSDEKKEPTRDEKAQKELESLLKTPPAESGFAFNPYDIFQDNLSYLEPKTRSMIVEEIKNFVGNGLISGRFSFIGQMQKEGIISLNTNVKNGWERLLSVGLESTGTGTKKLKDVVSEVKSIRVDSNGKDKKKISESDLMKIEKEKSHFKDFNPIEIGVLGNKQAETIGLTEKPVLISIQQGKKDDYGITHNGKHHEEYMLNEKKAHYVISTTLGNNNIQISRSIEKLQTPDYKFYERDVVSLYNPNEQTMLLLENKGTHLEIVSFHEANKEYQSKNILIKKNSLHKKKLNLR